MCLSTVTWQTDDPKQYKNKLKWETGYKVFVVGNTANGAAFYFPHYSNEFVLDKTLKASARFGMVVPARGEKYVPGFHIFTKEMAAKLYSTEQDRHLSALFEVKYRKISSYGTHAVHTGYPVDCVVAQEMKITRRMEWPTEPKQKKLRVWRDDTGKSRSGD